MASYPGDNSDQGYVVSQADMDAAANRPGVGTILGPNTRYRPSNPNLPANVGQPWIDTQTGHTINGQLATDGKTIITGFSGGNSQNTTGYDVNTGKQSQAMPHPWLDAAKNAAMIFGGSEGAGALMGAFGGAGAVGAGSGSSAMAPATGEAFTGGASSGLSSSLASSLAPTAGTATHSVLTPMITNAAINAAKSKLTGGSWGDAAISGGVGAASGMSGLGPTAGMIGKIAAGVAPTVAGMAMNRGSGTSGGTATGIGPSSGAMAKGFQYGTNNPDIASALASGQQAGISNQPFRAGYTVNYPAMPGFGAYPGSPATSYNMPAINQPLLPWGPTATQGIGPSQLPPQIAQPRIPSRG